jgi:hypothetical protein
VGTIWTPSGEHRPGEGPGHDDAHDHHGAHGAHDHDDEHDAGHDHDRAPSAEELAALRQVRDQIRATPVEAILANHAIQLFELALVYLGIGAPPDEQGALPPPDLPQAALAIDAMAALVEGIGARLGEHERTLRDGLAQLQVVYAQVADALRSQG